MLGEICHDDSAFGFVYVTYCWLSKNTEKARAVAETCIRVVRRLSPQLSERFICQTSLAASRGEVLSGGASLLIPQPSGERRRRGEGTDGGCTVRAAGRAVLDP